MATRHARRAPAQPDLFAAAPGAPGAAAELAPPPPGPGEEVVAVIRARLHAALALVRTAERMPWDDHLAIIREDNAFRFGKDLLPPAEGAALWAEFDAHMDRLYAIMNEGLEADPGI